VAHPDLVELPRRLDPVDVLILKRLDRLARSTRDLRNLLRVVADTGEGAVSFDQEPIGGHDEGVVGIIKPSDDRDGGGRE
jgi:hypothetical protein